MSAQSRRRPWFWLVFVFVVMIVIFWATTSFVNALLGESVTLAGDKPF